MVNKKQKKNYLIYGVIAVVIIAVVAGFVLKGSQEEEETIKIGAVYPLSGFLSIYGDTERTATEFAVTEINEQGGIDGKKIEVIYEDGKCSGSDALTAAKKLIDTDSVNMILGGSCSSETLAAAPYAKEKDVIMFTSIASSPDISNYSNIFRNTIITSEEGEILAQVAKERNYEKIAIITENNDFPISIKKGFLDNIDKQKIVYDELFNYGEQDFRTYLTKMESKDPDAIFIFTVGGGTGGQLVKQISEMEISGADLYGAEIPGTNDFLEITGDLANGVVFTDVPNLNKENKKLEQILAYFEEKDVTPVGDYFVAARYDSIYILKEALEQCGESNDCIKNYIKDNSFQGLIGQHTYNAQGDVQGIEISLKKIIDGRPVLMEK